MNTTTPSHEVFRAVLEGREGAFWHNNKRFICQRGIERLERPVEARASNLLFVLSTQPSEGSFKITRLDANNWFCHKDRHHWSALYDGLRSILVQHYSPLYLTIQALRNHTDYLACSISCLFMQPSGP